MELKNIVEPLIIWFQNNKRDLPWRHTNDSYKIWISEIMLQQTRVEAVIEYYNRFMKELPTLKSLSEVNEDKLLKLWEGLGYYSRARNLKKCAEMLIEKNLQELPRDYDELLKLPGIGPYSAGSIGSIAYNLKTPAIDGNVLRVMTRLLEDERDIMNNSVRKDYYQKLQSIMPDNKRDFTESLMELGAIVCLPNGIPLCENCPLKDNCQSYQHNTMLNYPQKTKLKERKIEEKTIIIFEYNGLIAIQKRPEKGLLASLYEFPNLSIYKDEIEEYLKEQHLNFKTIYTLGTSKHIFSHIEWHMIGYHIQLKEKIEDENLLWVTKQSIFTEYSIPNAFQKYIKSLKE